MVSLNSSFDANPRDYYGSRYGWNAPRRPRRAFSPKRKPTPPIDEAHRAFILKHHKALAVIGQDVTSIDWCSAFRHSGCIGLIIAALLRGHRTRIDIMIFVRTHQRCTYQHVGYLIGQFCGPDPKQHLWFKNEAGEYRLHGRYAAQKRVPRG